MRHLQQISDPPPKKRKSKIHGNVTAPNLNRELIESIGAMLRGGFVEHLSPT
jgi:hypothetical protein